MGAGKDDCAVQKNVFDSPDYQEISCILDRFAHFGVKLGLESTQALLSYLGDPHNQISVIHVAGTNGKGSVCAYLSTILINAGYRVGRYTSPHLLDWSEQICINNQPIPAASLLKIIQNVQTTAQLHHLDTTQFEVITAAAWQYFAEQKVDIAVIEVGLGGRLDATNVCDRPLASIITSIGRDHWQQLGDTLAEIASEKAGILKPRCPAIIGPVPLDAQTVIFQRSQSLDSPTMWVPPAKVLASGQLLYCPPTQEPPTQEPPAQIFPSTEIQRPSLSIPHTSDTLVDSSTKSFSYSLRLQGPHQRINSALAIATVHSLQEQGWAITDDHIRQGLSTTEWPGRLQWITWKGQKILLDGAHNTAAAEALRQYVDTLPQPIHWIVGMLETKDHQGVLKILLRIGDRLSLVPVPDSNTASPDRLVRIAKTSCSSLATCHTDKDVVTTLNQLAGYDSTAFCSEKTDSDHCDDLVKEGTIVLCGSLYLVGYVLKHLNATT
ncbi:MAG: folylpolyglutamate synthase/dihydrofolate synthase family protein [Cyanobacteria bacterium P01_F01_bin.150]